MPGPRPLTDAEPGGAAVPRARALVTSLRWRRWGRAWGVVPVVLVVALLGLRALLHTDPRDRLRAGATEPGDPPGTRAGAGSLAVNRGGPVIVGFVSPTRARLTIGGRELVGEGLVKDRLVLPAAPLGLRFAGPPTARLVWSPVGRRGDPEYVPASSLSPAEPARATFDGPGATPLDGVIALGLLVVIAGTALMLARRRLVAVPRPVWLALAGVLALGLVVRLIDLGGAGQTWDEDVNWAAGRNYVTNLLDGDFSALAWRWNYEHPPVMKYLAGIGAQLADGFGPARALSALWVALGCALLVPIGRRLVSLRVGVLAGMIAALLPPLVAHGQVVGHEAPTVLWWSLGVLLAVHAHDGLPPTADVRAHRHALLRRLVAIGAVVGIATASRFVNGLVGPLCVVIVLVQAPASARRLTLLATPLMAAASVVTLWAVWPRLWLHPVGALRASLAKLDVAHALEPFLGAITNHPPASYFVVYLACVLPLGVLLAVAGGLVRAAVRSDRAMVIALAWLVVPLIVTASPVRQDGVRYVMPCLLALALLAALGLDGLATRLRVRAAGPALAAAMALYLGVTLVRLHPYYLDAFGEHVGGAAGVARRQWLETAWWGEGVDRAVAFVNTHAAPGAGPPRLHRARAPRVVPRGPVVAPRPHHRRGRLDRGLRAGARMVPGAGGCAQGVHRVARRPPDGGGLAAAVAVARASSTAGSTAARTAAATRRRRHPSPGSSPGSTAS